MTIKDKRMFDRGDGRRLATKFPLSGTMVVFHLAGSILCVFLLEIEIHYYFFDKNILNIFMYLKFFSRLTDIHGRVTPKIWLKDDDKTSFEKAWGFQN